MAEEDGANNQVTAPVALVDAEGVLRDGWRDTLPEDIRGDKVFDRVSNFEGIMKTLSSAERAFGKDKIPVPNEASSEVEWDAYYAAGGRPETAADYNLAKPEGLPDENWNQELATAAQELFHKIGISKKQAEALFAFNNNNVITQLTKNAQDAELAATALKDGLYAEWGNAYEQKKHDGNVAIEKGTEGNEEFKQRLVQKFGNDPDFIRFAAAHGKNYRESGAITAESIPTPTDIQATIDKEMAEPSYGLDYAKHGFTKAQHKIQVEKVAALYREKTKHAKTG